MSIWDNRLDLIDLTPFSLGKIADMYTKLYASRSYVYAVARACDRGKVSRKVSFVDLITHDHLLTESFTKFVELCRSNTVFDRESCRSCNGRNAVFGW